MIKHWRSVLMFKLDFLRLSKLPAVSRFHLVCKSWTAQGSFNHHHHHHRHQNYHHHHHHHHHNHHHDRYGHCLVYGDEYGHGPGVFVSIGGSPDQYDNAQVGHLFSMVMVM